MRAGVALLALWVACVAAAADAPPAVLQVAEPSFDAGKVYRGEPVRHAFLLRNTGPAEVRIDAKPG